MFSLPQMLCTLKRESLADLNSTLDISRFFPFLAQGKESQGKHGSSYYTALRNTFAYLNQKAQQVKALARIHRWGHNTSWKRFLFSLCRLQYQCRSCCQRRKNIEEMPFCSGLNHWISFLMEILTFSFQTQSSRLPERIRRMRQTRLELLICTRCRMLAHWLMQRNSNLLKQMHHWS